jgi:hypothetical protein
VQGKITVCNADQSALTAQKDTIAKTLTSQVQSSCAGNSKSQVSVNTVTQLDNGDLEVAYTCSGVSDHTSAQGSLHNASQCDEIKQTVSKCSKTDSDSSKSTQKSSVAGTEKAATQASTTAKKLAESTKAGKT